MSHRSTARSRQTAFLAEGIGHAFTALSAEATMLCLCSAPYAPGRERGVHPLDPALGIPWPLDEQLPRYADCVTQAERLRAGFSS
jgi:dTDP-4-dehydrorhamnose 3,5-epimerase